jgi:hypothetical protein
MRRKGPVIASKPVAKTMMSSGTSLPDCRRMPVSVIRSMGSVRMSASSTFSRLKVSK